MSVSGTTPPRRRPTMPRPRKRADAARAAAYSRFVSGMKIGLAAMAAALTLSLLYLSGTFDGPDELDITFAEVTSRTDDLRMVSPRIADVDNQGRPYTFTATSAVQDSDDPALIHLDEVAGDLVGDQGASWTAVTSRKGRLNTDEEWIDLVTEVELFTDGGFNFKGDVVRVHLDTGDISSDLPVFAQGPAGTAEGGGLRVTESGDTITLINGSKVVIFDSGSGSGSGGGFAGLFEPGDG